METFKKGGLHGTLGECFSPKNFEKKTDLIFDLIDLVKLYDKTDAEKIKSVGMRLAGCIPGVSCATNTLKCAQVLWNEIGKPLWDEYN